jgi:hypothetical protein
MRRPNAPPPKFQLTMDVPVLLQLILLVIFSLARASAITNHTQVFQALLTGDVVSIT